MKNFDNKTKRLVDDLKSELHKGNKLRIAAASFSIYAYEALKMNYLKSMNCSFYLQVISSLKRRHPKRNVNFLFRDWTKSRRFMGMILKFSCEMNYLKKQLQKRLLLY